MFELPGKICSRIFFSKFEVLSNQKSFHIVNHRQFNNNEISNIDVTFKKD